MTKDSQLEEFANNLHKLMTQQGISQKELSDLTGISAATISRYLSKQQYPMLTAATKLAHALKCKSLSELMGEFIF